MAIKKDGKWRPLAGGAQIPKIQPALNPHGKDRGVVRADSASIPRMQAVNNGGQDINEGASIPKMTPAQTSQRPTNSTGHQGNSNRSSNQTAKPSDDKKK